MQVYEYECVQLEHVGHFSHLKSTRSKKMLQELRFSKRRRYKANKKLEFSEWISILFSIITNFMQPLNKTKLQYATLFCRTFHNDLKEKRQLNNTNSKMNGDI